MKRFLNILVLLVSASFCLQASAATFTVTSTADSGAGTLRAALDPVTGAQDGDTINFQAGLSGTITLTTGQMVVSHSITISGPGANNLAVNGNASSRVFFINSGTTVTISGLTITKGFGGGGNFA